jgi:serpin B
VSDQTEDKIKDLIPQGMIQPWTRLVLTNAIYFNATWWSPFEKKYTRDEVFYLLEGGNVTVPMMTQTQRFKYAEGDLYQAVELPYDRDELSMIIMLPDSGQFESFENSLDATLGDQITSHLADHKVMLAMPKFEFESDFYLASILVTMGMPAAFSSEADFSGMTGNRGLNIGEVLHKAFVSVDESGTEAAAATAVIIEAGSAPGQSEERPMIMRIDRPFIFLIRDIETGTILFIGRVMNPGV